MSKLIDDLELYSDLVASVGTGRHNRPLTPIECSDLIMRLKNETDESWEELSKRLHLGKKSKITTMDAPRDTTQIRHFAKLQNLSRKNAYALGFGLSNEGAIGFTIGALVADLPEKKDHDLILDAVLQSQNGSRSLKKEDIKKIVQMRKASSDTPLESIIKRIIDFDPEPEESYVMLVQPDPELLDIIHEKKDKDDPDAKEFLKNLIDLQFIDKQVNLIKLRNNLILITMDKENFEKTENEWKTKNQNFTNYFNSLLKRGLNIG
ncbi:MAG: hypothetical protein HOB51_01760 [Thaumarchaeota archaeon]|nr:hypothetical protein [Nitrososphaerota archaeon]